MSLVSLVLVLLLLAVIAAIAVLAAGGGESFGTEPADRAPYGELPPGEVRSDDVRRLRFSLAFRGYRMDEVDAVVDRLAQELADRDRALHERDEPAPIEPQPAADQPLPPTAQA